MNALKIIKPRCFYAWACLLMSLILIVSTWSAYKNLRANLNETIEIQRDQIHLYRGLNFSSNPNPEASLPLFSFTEKSGHAEFIINFPQTIKTGVLEIEVDENAELWKNYLYLRVFNTSLSNEKGRGKSLNIINNKWLPLQSNNHTYRIPLYRDVHKASIVVEIKYLGPLPGIPINSIKIKPASFYDFPAGALLICFGVFATTFLPGMLIALAVPKFNILPLPVVAFILSLPVNIISLIIYKCCNTELSVLPIVIVISFSYLFSRKKPRVVLQSNFAITWKKNIDDINIWVGILVLLSVVLSFGYSSPVYNIHEGHITSEHTFFSFTAHDSIFQYVNGRSIIDGDFEKYYGTKSNKKLLFLPQDREILPGLSYAGIIITITNLFGRQIAESYFAYAVFFLVNHALLLSMIFAWLRETNLKLAYATTFLICTTPVFWVLAMVGWFKLTGAALMLAAIYLVREKPEALLRWGLAGVLLGLSKNYHGGNALAFPIFTLWMLFVTYKSIKNISLGKIVLMFVTITFFACVLMLPWNIFTKYVWGVSTHNLISSHFLNNNFVPDSLWLSVVNFFHNQPWHEQIGIRWERAIGLFNIQWLIENFANYDLYATSSVTAWLKLSSSYCLPAVLPYFLISLCILIGINRSDIYTINSRDGAQPSLWLNQFGFICFLNVVFLSFLFYGPVSVRPDITWHLPSLIIFGIITQLTYWCYRLHPSTYIIWLCIGFFS